MKKPVIISIVIIVILVASFLVWEFIFKKSVEGEACKVNEDCAEGFNCVMNVCSSGGPGSLCSTKDDCSTKFCVKNKCTEGKEGDPCNTLNDCDGTLCVNSVCSQFSEKSSEELFQEYFSSFYLGIVTEPSEGNPSVFQEKNTFKLTDQFCVKAKVLKDVNIETEVYDLYEEVVVVPKISGGLNFTKGINVWCNDILSQLSVGKEYEYKVYIGDALVAILPFEITE